jgi:hypothetical protein
MKNWSTNELKLSRFTRAPMTGSYSLGLCAVVDLAGAAIILRGRGHALDARLDA